jgi:type I restriction enzyme M protein
MREVVEKFDFDNTISKLDEAGLLFQVMQRFNDPRVNLHPDDVDNATMGTIFEELIRKFNEALNENPGGHFTPRDVVHLMVDLLLAGDEEQIRTPNKTLTVYDPCCGSGGMLTIAKEHITAGVRKEEQNSAVNGSEVQFERGPINDTADIHLFGQEVNPETFAVCKSDLYMKSADGGDAEQILYGSTLSNDRHAGQPGFDYLIANPPYGKDWKRDQDAVRAEHDNTTGRFGPGLPRISDGQLLHMLSHTKETEQGGSRVAIIMNGSPLFTGDAGSGESEIRRYILENDWLETLIALPERLFYNTGIATYVWILTNRKSPRRKGRVQLIDASSEYFWRKMKNRGAKNRRIPFDRAQEILQILADFKHDDVRTIPAPDGDPEKARQVTVSKIFPTTHFGFRKITVERPLRLNFEASPERIARLDDERAFANLATSKKKQTAAREKEKVAGREQQDAIRRLLETLPSTRFAERAEFEKVFAGAARSAGMKLPAPVKKAILSALSEHDPEAPICRDSKGEPEPDSELRDSESVPLSEPIEAFFEREVKPHVPDAWIDRSKCDEKDHQVGIVGYEINFNRYFYRYTPPRDLADIESDIRAIEKDIVRMLAEVTGSAAEDLAG